MKTKSLPHGLTLKEVTADELHRVYDLHFKRVYANRQIENPPGLVGNPRLSHPEPWTLRLVLYLGEQPIGWHNGFTTDHETFYMQNSAVIEEMRGKGYYGVLLDGILDFVREEGFQVVTSLHHPNNAAILIPKLKKGFVITSTQFHERFRFLVEMKYFMNAERGKAYGRAMGLEL